MAATLWRRFQMHVLNENIWILIRISRKFVFKVQLTISRTGDKILYAPTMAWFTDANTLGLDELWKNSTVSRLCTDCFALHCNAWVITRTDVWSDLQGHYVFTDLKILIVSIRWCYDYPSPRHLLLVCRIFFQCHKVNQKFNSRSQGTWYIQLLKRKGRVVTNLHTFHFPPPEEVYTWHTSSASHPRIPDSFQPHMALWSPPKIQIKSGLILGLRPNNETRRYFVTTALIGWAKA